MQNNEFDLLFPSRAIEPLRNLRDKDWEGMIDHLAELDAIDPERVAFVLFMVRLIGCTNCQSDSFRAMRGCMICSSNTIKRYKGSDKNLIELYNDAKRDVVEYMREV